MGVPVGSEDAVGEGVGVLVAVTVASEVGVAVAEGEGLRVDVSVGTTARTGDAAGVAVLVAVSAGSTARIGDAAGVAVLVAVSVGSTGRTGEAADVAVRVAVSVGSTARIGDAAGDAVRVAVSVGSTARSGDAPGEGGLVAVAVVPGVGEVVGVDVRVDVPVGVAVDDGEGAADAEAEIAGDALAIFSCASATVGDPGAAPVAVGEAVSAPGAGDDCRFGTITRAVAVFAAGLIADSTTPGVVGAGEDSADAKASRSTVATLSIATGETPGAGEPLATSRTGLEAAGRPSGKRIT